MTQHKISVVKYEPTDPRLGRNVEHDERSWNYQLLPKETKPKQVTTHWSSKAPPLNQGDLGMCTGCAEAQWLNTDFAKLNKFLTEADALNIYSLGTHLDNIAGHYPPDDTGCTGNAVAKAGVKLGYLKSYSWVFSFSALQAALEVTPVMLGTVWTNDMFNPVNGLVKVGKLTDANIVGGHEYLGAGIEFDNKVIVCRNSWGDANPVTPGGDYWPGCKPGGYFAISFSDMQSLLEMQGDVTIPKK